MLPTLQFDWDKTYEREDQTETTNLTIQNLHANNITIFCGIQNIFTNKIF